jgi:hypothetical protein
MHPTVRFHIVLVALAALLSAGAANAEKAKSPPPKSTTADPCAGDRMKSACKNMEATRSLLRTAPPPSKKPSDAGSGAKSLAK